MTQCHTANRQSYPNYSSGATNNSIQNARINGKLYKNMYHTADLQNITKSAFHENYGSQLVA